jgi:DNA-binding NtrC family response regulator
MSADLSPSHPTSLLRDWILIVDDDEPIRNLLTIALSSDELEVVTVPSAAEAIRVLDLRASEPLLVLADVLMPGGNGMDLARKLTESLKRSKLALMSGHLTNVAWWPVELRDITYIAKPFRIAEVMALVETARVEYKRE